MTSAFLECGVRRGFKLAGGVATKAATYAALQRGGCNLVQRYGEGLAGFATTSGFSWPSCKRYQRLPSRLSKTCFCRDGQVTVTRSTWLAWPSPTSKRRSLADR